MHGRQTAAPAGKHRTALGSYHCHLRVFRRTIRLSAVMCAPVSVLRAAAASRAGAVKWRKAQARLPPHLARGISIIDYAVIAGSCEICLDTEAD